MKLWKSFVLLLLGSFILLLASSPADAYSGHYYVIPGSISLKECPAHECAPLLTVYQGEKVEILERTPKGWSKVRLVERSAMGWIPSDLLTYSPGTGPEFKPPYHVNTESLPLREHPRPEARVLTTLQFNDPVEMLGVSASGWAQVRDLRSNVIGYVPPRYLSATTPVAPTVSAKELADKAEKAADKAEEYIEGIAQEEEPSEEDAKAAAPWRRAPALKAPPKKKAPQVAPTVPKVM